LYGILLALLSAFVHRIAPEVPLHFRYAGMGAGASVFLCGLIGLCGFARHFWALLTQIVVSLFLLAELIATWRRADSSHRLGVLFLGLMLMFSIPLAVMLARPPPEEPNPFEPRDLQDQRD
jgi:hypothetical protein